MSTPTPEPLRAKIIEALEAGQAIVCATQCWACQFQQHERPKRWHTWADSDDIEHAAATGQPDPRDTRCACRCADAPRVEEGK